MSDAAAWIDHYTARASDLWDRGARTSVELASRWGARSLADSEWTVETVTADVIEASELLTPLIGEAVELWLEFVQQIVSQGEHK